MLAAFLRRPGRFVTLSVSVVAMGLTVGLAGASGGPLGAAARSIVCTSPSAVDLGCDRAAPPPEAPVDRDAPANPVDQPVPVTTPPTGPATAFPTDVTVSEDEPATVGTAGGNGSGDGDDHGSGNGNGNDDDDQDSDDGDDGDDDPDADGTPGLYASGGSPLFSLPNLAAGKRVERCISVLYVGSRPAHVQLYAASAGTGLDGFLDVVVVRGQMPSATNGGCRGFTPDGVDYVGEGKGVLYKGRLTGFPAEGTEGLQTGDAWRSGESHSYRITTSIVSARAAQGLSVSFDFVWKART